jgi:hypothetical protein
LATPNRATDVVVLAAMAYGAVVRLWSTVLNGNLYAL